MLAPKLTFSIKISYLLFSRMKQPVKQRNTKRDSNHKISNNLLNSLDGMENAFWVGVVGVLGGLGPARAWSI
jgi:hypothetical protein